MMINHALLSASAHNYRLRFINRLSYTLLTIKSLLINDEIHGGIVFVDGIRVAGPRAGALRFLYQEIIKDEVYRPSFTRDGMTVVDCGANIGLAATYFATTLPGSRIYAYEPNPEAFTYLKANATQFGPDRITPVESAVAGSEGTVLLYSSQAKASMRSSIIPDRSSAGRSFQVKSVRLSDVLAKLEDIDLVKLDIEGAEVAVLADLSESGLLAKPREYIVEFHNFVSGKSRMGEFIATFEAAGYRVAVEAERVAASDYQDVIIRAVRLI